MGLYDVRAAVAARDGDKGLTYASALVLYAVGALLVTGGGRVDIGVMLVGWIVAYGLTGVVDMRPRWLGQVAAVLVVLVAVAWLLAPWLLWWHRGWEG